MSTTDNPLVNSKPVAGGAAPVIRANILNTHANELPERIVNRHVPAAVASIIVHFILGGLFVLVNLIFGGKALEAAEGENTVIETAMDEDKAKDIVADNPDVGLDANLPTNYNIDRIEDISVPGPLKPDEAVGNQGEGVPQTVPPPPGFGDSSGQGGGLESMVAGTGAMGAPGGMGGPPLRPGMGFPGRSGATRQKMIQEGGGNSASEACVSRGLIWLAKVQKPSGAWVTDGSTKDEIAGTGLALLPFLAAGQTHKGGTGKQSYTKNVANGIAFLIAKQRPTGDFGSQNMYVHAIATMALCEAYGMTADPKLKAPAQLACNFIIKAQHSAGGWRYRPGDPGDLSVTGWQLQALKSGHLAGLAVPKEVLNKVTSYLETVAGGQGSDMGATYGYTGPGTGATSMTAVGLLCRQYLGWGPRNPKLARGVEILAKEHPPKAADFDIYYYYYASQVVHFFGGPMWRDPADESKGWNPVMRDLLIDMQVKGENQNSGSWNPDAHHMGGASGRLGTTCLCLLTLEIYYRHLPLYKRDSSGLKDLEQ